MYVSKEVEGGRKGLGQKKTIITSYCLTLVIIITRGKHTTRFI